MVVLSWSIFPRKVREKQWIEEAKKRTSLKFLAIPKMGKTHYVWKTVPNDCIEVK
jgi:hypothetical protein